MDQENVPIVGSRIILSQKTKHGGVLIQENGKIWIMIKYQDRVLAFGNKPGLLIESVMTHNWRWVQFPEDKHLYWSSIFRYVN